MTIFSTLKCSISKSVNRIINRKSGNVSARDNNNEELQSPGHSQSSIKSKLLFWTSTNKNRAITPLSTSDNSYEMNSPDSYKSVNFQESITWPFIDEEF
uniref:AGC-kinase C-terminal domain-containing protein n=1 Tax=Parastrongyloides trichosuri TaxID=131310 RepID=A0A0N4Z7S4_PARTI